MNAEIEALAARLWDEMPNRASCPAWEQLGETTKGVWRERAAARLYGEFA